MKLDVENWKPFAVNKILTIMNGKGITKEEIQENKGTLPVVQSGETDNGVFGKVNIDYCKSMKYTYTVKPCLTVARSGSAGFVSFHAKGCVVGDSAKILLLNDDVATTESYLFLRTVLMMNKFKYAYGRKVTEEKYINDYIALPICFSDNSTPFIDKDKKYSEEGYVPDWEFMENYIKSLHHKPLTTRNKAGQTPDLNISDWKEFTVNRLFRIQSTKGKTTDDLTNGNDIPYIAAKHNMNGFEMLCSANDMNKYISDGNCIVFIQIGEGSCGYVNYINEPFIGMSGKVCCGYIDDTLNQYVGLFIATILCQERPKYSFGRSWTGDRLFKTTIKLPVKHNPDDTSFIDKNKIYSDDGYVPDWDFMENYIKSLPYGDRI
mgnify:CR=1 FL=1